MNAIERLRPEVRPLDAEWSAATLESILSSHDPVPARRSTTGRRPTLDGAATAGMTQLEDTPPKRPGAHRPRRWAVGLAAAAAGAFVFAAPAGPSTSPAYAVEQTADGDVIVTIHELEDSAGLEAALHDNGIDAEVIFESNLVGHVPDFDELPPRDPDVIPDCGADPAPATLSREGDDWILLIPATSPLQDRPVSLRTTTTGTLELEYASLNDPWTHCMVLS